MYTSCRPGSLLSTIYYPDWFLHYKVSDAKCIWNVTQTIWVALADHTGWWTWKIHCTLGYCGVQRITQRRCVLLSPPFNLFSQIDAYWHRLRYTLTSVGDSRYLSLDSRMQMIALGLRQHAFCNFNTLEELESSSDVHLAWKPSFLELPVFCASGPAGASMNYTWPMTDVRCRLTLNVACIRVGLGGTKTCFVWCFQS